MGVQCPLWVKSRHMQRNKPCPLYPNSDRKSGHRLAGRMLLKATLIYRRIGNLRAVQLLLGHTKIESTVRYRGIDADDTLAIAEQVDVLGYRAE